jgi:3-oxoacyl-[acyl-carrier protein] reductase
MNLGLEGRVCVIAGDTRAIGAATARMLSQEGARVLSAGSEGADIELDLTAPDAGERLLQACPEPPWALVNNFGTGEAPERLTDSAWEQQWELHVMAPMRLMRAAAPVMADAGGGRVVNVTSPTAVMEAAELSLSRVFADAFAARGLLVNAVTPGAAEDEVAAAVTFLCSERSSDVTGAAWAVDAGGVRRG